ncbi:MAG: toll/interleukin-1 receptor domain-containing protein [Planctomycetaceae bacterium]
MPKRKVAISYAWKAKSGRKFKNAVQRLCDQLREADVDVTRDVECLKFGDNLRTFMRRIGRSGKICVFLSEAYLQSENCMYELFIAFQRDCDAEEKLAKRLRFFLLPDVLDYKSRTGDKRKALKTYWRTQIESHERLLDEEKADGGMESSTLESLNRLKEIRSHLTRILNYAFGHLGATEFDAGMQQLKEEYGLTKKPLPAAKLPKVPIVAGGGAVKEETANQAAAFEKVFRKNLEAIDDTLEKHPDISQLLQKANPRLFQNNRFQVASVTGAMLDRAEVNNTFQKLETSLGRQGSGSLDKQQLFSVCGQLLVISINPSWVSRQRNRRDGAAVELPGANFELSVSNSGKKSQFVNLLHLAAVAVAGSPADLKRLFSAARDDDRALFDLPHVTAGITLAERRVEFQKFLIRSLLGPKLKLPAGNTASDQEIINHRFRDAMRLGQLEMQQGRPFYGTQEVQIRLEECLERGTIPADCLVWLVGVQGDLDDVMPQYFDTFYHLHSVYTALKNRKL